ncbi:MAG TPA: hypothetical protein VGR51_05505 [Thermoplasmata archaeon]|jgi:hypothetical protein|nr:hypothetical protein [Thermoplasmata archaeon]
MPLTDDEWRAFINEYNGAMTDVEADLAASLERNRLDLEALRDRGEVPAGEAQALIDTTRESLLRVQERLNTLKRRFMTMRGAGEL